MPGLSENEKRARILPITLSNCFCNRSSLFFNCTIKVSCKLFWQLFFCTGLTRFDKTSRFQNDYSSPAFWTNTSTAYQFHNNFRFSIITLTLFFLYLWFSFYSSSLVFIPDVRNLSVVPSVLIIIIGWLKLYRWLVDTSVSVINTYCLISLKFQSEIRF